MNYPRAFTPISSVWLLALSLVLIQGRTWAETVVLQDSFHYSSWSEMQKGTNWKLLSSNPSMAQPGFVPLDNGTHTAIALLNRGIQQDFSSSAVLTKDFTLAISIQHDHPKALQYVAITGSPDAEGKVSGYAIAWDSGTSGKGLFSITKFSMPESSIGTGTGGEKLSSPIESPVPIVDAKPSTLSQFAVITLNWKKPGILTLSVNGAQVANVSDTSYQSFSRLYIDGCYTGYFTDLKITQGAESK